MTHIQQDPFIFKSSHFNYYVLSELDREQTPYIVVIIVDVKGSAPQKVGAKMLVTSHGLVQGTVGGGPLEEKAIQYAALLLEKGSQSSLSDPSTQSPSFNSRTVTWNLQKDLHMSCGGEAILFFDAHHFQCQKIFVFGAGHIGQALARQLSSLTYFQIYFLDTRKEWLDLLTKEFAVSSIDISSPASLALPAAAALLFPTPLIRPVLLDKFASPSSFQWLLNNSRAKDVFVLLSPNQAIDISIIEMLLQIHSSPSFIGVIGSTSKSNKLIHQLKEKGYSNDQLQGIRCPLGLIKGTKLPSEIALSIAAELIQWRLQNITKRPD